ncbi:MAG TPA: zf-TFIIB domain-containing protein [Chitinophagaceae bacterium]
MKCPNCDQTLVMADRQGIEIDYCPNCRGVWLDKGELDKIIERSADYVKGVDESQPVTPPPPPPQYRNDSYQDPYYKKDRYNEPYYKNKKKKGFLSDFFDFD